MDFPLATVFVIYFGIFIGYNAQSAGTIYNCKEGEAYYSCRSPCQPTCDSLTNGFRGNCSGPCIGGCFCRNGLVRNTDNTCIPPEDCFRPECQENEEFHECGSACEVNCTNYADSSIFCTKPCYSGCFCKQDYVRDSNRRCVDPSTCNVAPNQQCNANEHYVNCVSFCNNCWELNNCKTPYCLPGCDCRPGYYKDYYGQCISESQCYSSLYERCQGNEVYLKCGPSCRSSCQNYRTLLYDSCKRACVPGCHCEGNLVLGPDGKCIRPEFCSRDQPVECPINEIYYTCVPSCRHTCETYNDVNANCDTNCFKGCFCKGGLVRRSDGACVPPNECAVLSSDPPCPLSEVFYQCKPTCRTTCQSLNSPNEICPFTCEPGCYCQPGLVRNDVGVCVSPEECLSPVRPCPAGEVFYNCIPTCRTTCETMNATGQCPRVCISGCACRSGLVKRMDGICVRPENCLTECGPNEEYNMCGSACVPTCSNPNPTCLESCVKGCFCRDGFVYSPDGICIPTTDCPRRAEIPRPCPDISGRRRGSNNENSTDTTTALSETGVPSTPANNTETISITAADNNTTLSNAEPTTLQPNVSDPTSSKTDISTSPKPDISTSPKTDISTNPKPDISTSPKPDISTSPKPDISTSSNSDISTSPKPDISTNPKSDVTSSKTASTTTASKVQTETSAVMNAETLAMTTKMSDTTDVTISGEDKRTETVQVVTKRKENVQTPPVTTLADTANITVTEITIQS